MSEKLPTAKLNVTKDYRLFHRDSENRNFYAKKHRKLFESMKNYGFLRSHPISCIRDSKGKLHVKDGQHRLAFAEVLNLPVYWVEEVVDYDIAAINTTGVSWNTKDYAEKFAAQGSKPYIDGLAFAERHGLPVGIAFSILSGNTGFSNISTEFKTGKFTIRDWQWAETVASVYGPLGALEPKIRNARFLEACMQVTRVAGFDSKRMVEGAERCRELLVQYSSRESYVEMLEKIYNFRKSKLVPLKVLATMAMRERNAAHKSKNGKLQLKAE
jgi:hypothetical protein